MTTNENAIEGRRTLLSLRKQRKWTVIISMIAAVILTITTIIAVTTSTANANEKTAPTQNQSDVKPVYDGSSSSPVGYLMTTKTGSTFFCFKADKAYTCQQLG